MYDLIMLQEGEAVQFIFDSLVCRSLLRLFQILANVWKESAIYNLYRRFMKRCSRVLKASSFVRFICRQSGTIAQAWPSSLFCRFLSGLINLPAAALHRLYRQFKSVWDGSTLMSVVYFLGENTPILLGWLLLLFMNIPYEIWNNGYPLISGVLLILLIIAAGMRRSSLRLDIMSIGPYVLAFFVAVALSWPSSLYPSDSARFLLYFISCALCILIVVSTAEKEDSLERLAGFGCLGMLGTAVYGAIQRIQGVEVDEMLVDVSLNPDMPGRIFSFYENPNSFAVLLVLLIPIAVGLFLGAGKKFWRVVGLVSALFGAFALIMSYSRACWGGLAFAAVVFVFMWNRKLIPVLIVVCIVAIPFLPGAILTRILTIFNSNDTSIASRIPLYEAALKMIAIRPVAGAGLGTDAVRHAITELGLYLGTNDYVHSHNTFLELWLETGLLGLLTFLASMVHAVKRGVKACSLPNTSQPMRLLTIGCISGLCGSLLSGLVDYIWNYPRVMFIFWFVAALLLAAIKLSFSAQNKLQHTN